MHEDEIANAIKFALSDKTDQLHPTVEGSRLFATRMANAIKDLGFPTMHEELIARLRATRMGSALKLLSDGRYMGIKVETETPINPNGPEAAEAIAALSARVAELEGRVGVAHARLED